MTISLIYFIFIFFSSVLKKYPSKFIGCCLANPADDGSGIKQLEHLIVKVTSWNFLVHNRNDTFCYFLICCRFAYHQEKFRAVRFNPTLWPSGQKVCRDENEQHCSSTY
jgi:hypothetical protein